MSQLYHKKEWVAYRDKCLKIHGYACENCGSTKVLQVHHPHYIKGLKPWQYSTEFCEVICRKCHAEIHGHIPPSSGWIILHSDLEDNTPSEIIECGYCTKDIRWHVTIYHPEWGELIVGTECAENLSLGDEIREIKSFNRRLRTFIASPRWKKTQKGIKIEYNEYYVLIYEKNNGYMLKINNIWGKITYDNIECAKIKAFGVINSKVGSNK